MPVDVTVTNPDSSSATLVGSFTYGALWTPAEITTALWLDASDSSTITLDGSGNVEQWDDKSGNNRDVSSPSSGERPGVSDGWIAYDGSDYQRTASTIALTDFTLAVTIQDDQPTQEGYFASVGYNDANSLLFFNASGSDVVQVGIRKSGSNRFIPATFSGAAGTGTTKTIIVFRRAGNSIRYWIDGELELDDTNSDNEVTVNQMFELGFAAIRNKSGSHFTGKIGDVVLQSEAASDDVRQIIEGYLAHKWGLEANLPAEHPYKSAAPVITP